MSAQGFGPDPHDAGGMDSLSVKALQAFKHSMALHRRLLSSVLAGDQQMHPAQAGCVQVLRANDGISQSELADLLHVSRPSVTTMLQRMEAAGIIERRIDEADSRVTRVYLSDAGRELAEQMRQAFGTMLEASIGRLPDDDKREFIRILGKLNDAVADSLRERGVTLPVHPHLHHPPVAESEDES